jgi:hypothetical protein
VTTGLRLVPYELRLVRLALGYALFAGRMHPPGEPWRGLDGDGCPVPCAGDVRRRAHARDLAARIDLFLARHDRARHAREEHTR